MKRHYLYLFLTIIVVCATGCEKFISFDFTLTDRYEAVYCFIPDKRTVWINDTTICFSKENLQLLPLQDWGDGKRHGQISLGSGTIDSLFDSWQCETVSFFILDKDIVENCSWDYVVQNYCILQRYDFSKADLVRLKCQISYPPTEEMSKVYMYPPYTH